MPPGNPSSRYGPAHGTPCRIIAGIITTVRIPFVAMMHLGIYSFGAILDLVKYPFDAVLALGEYIPLLQP